MAGLQVQAVYGDHNDANHKVGFLTYVSRKLFGSLLYEDSCADRMCSQNLKNFVPQPLWALKKPNEWEAIILKEHSRYAGAKKSMDDAKLDYLSIVKTWSFYGTTFFPACKVQGGAKNLPSKVVIGVNYEGIRLYKQKNNKVYDASLAGSSSSRRLFHHPLSHDILTHLYRSSSLSTSSRRSAAGPRPLLPLPLSMAIRTNR